MISHN